MKSQPKNLSHTLNHLGENREQYFNAIAPPIIQTSNFSFSSVQSFRKALHDELENTIYTRGNNPTVKILREKLAALEKTEDALVFASGSAAVAATVIAQVKAGDHIVCVQSPYSWTYKLLHQFLPRFGVKTTFVNAQKIETIEAAIKENTKVLYLESPNSMTFELQDLKQCAQLAKKRGLVSIIDNSHASPYYQNPADFGIDLILHSGTKYLNGHSDVVFGVVCGNHTQIRKIFESEFMTLGAIMSPLEAAMVLRGLRTFPLRMEQSNKTAFALAKWLETQPKVKKVYHPLLPNSPQIELANAQMRGAGGLFSIELVTEDIEKIERFSNHLTRFLIAASWGGHESLQIPVCAFYGMENREKPTLPINFIRFYAGLESVEWLKEDFIQAFAEI